MPFITKYTYLNAIGGGGGEDREKIYFVFYENDRHIYYIFISDNCRTLVLLYYYDKSFNIRRIDTHRWHSG